MINLNNPHRRLNLLTNEWVLVSPQRGQRPWQGKNEKVTEKTNLIYDENCYLCPGNKRVSGQVNPKYDSTFVFENDTQAILPIIAGDVVETEPFLKAVPEYGKCRVVVYTPDHSKTMADLNKNEIVQIINAWKNEYRELGNDPKINHVQIFENKGEIMGCSNPHPHGQIWSQFSLPSEVVKEQLTQEEYFLDNGTSLLADYIKHEVLKNERIVYKNNNFVALVPFWATWPFEILILPLSPLSDLGYLSDLSGNDLAEVLSMVTRTYDKLFNIPFPYSMGIHQAPTDKTAHPEWQMHFHFCPPLLRNANVKKFMVGYELLAEPQRDITAEAAAERLRSLI